MKYSAVIALGLAAFVSAQSVEELVGTLPSCVGTCLTDAAVKAGCGETDYACQCDEEKFLDISVDATPCVVTACSPGEAGQVMPIIDEICAAAAAAPPADDEEEDTQQTTTETEADPTATETDADPTATETDADPTETDVPATSSSEAAAVPTAAWNYAAVAGAAGVVAAGMM